MIAPTRDQLFSLVQLFKRVGFYVRWEEAEAAFRNRDMFNVTDFRNAWKVDLIVRKTRAFSVSEFERREPVEIDGLNFVITSAEDILIAKLEWFKIGESDRQLEDAAGIIRIQGDNLDTGYIETWVGSLGLYEEMAEGASLGGLHMTFDALSQIAQGDLTARRRSGGSISVVNRRRFGELNPASWTLFTDAAAMSAVATAAGNAFG
ncbi:MAG: hypothetical protein QOI58_1064 [Thermoanaerobaculia bacterium]|nr:hypothetical protein [Thermoanaerobaculia bacterium]